MSGLCAQNDCYSYPSDCGLGVGHIQTSPDQSYVSLSFIVPSQPRAGRPGKPTCVFCKAARAVPLFGVQAAVHIRRTLRYRCVKLEIAMLLLPEACERHVCTWKAFACFGKRGSGPTYQISSLVKHTTVTGMTHPSVSPSLA